MQSPKLETWKKFDRLYFYAKSEIKRTKYHNFKYYTPLKRYKVLDQEKFWKKMKKMLKNKFDFFKFLEQIEKDNFAFLIFLTIKAKNTIKSNVIHH